jgi:protein-disulfide isomerase
MPPKPQTARARGPGGRPAVPRRTLLLILAGAVVVAGVAIGLSLAFSGGGRKSTSTNTTTPVNVDSDVSAVAGIQQHGLVLGNPLARVTLTEYIDISCPICQSYVISTFPQIAQDYVRSGKAKVEARVLDFLGPSSPRGRQLVLAAAAQNKAWQMIELLYRNQGDETQDWLTNDLQRAIAAKIAGLDTTKLFDDASSTAVSEQATQMDVEAQQDQVRGTPTFVLTTPDGQRHLLGAGNPGFDAFKSAFNRALGT